MVEAVVAYLQYYNTVNMPRPLPSTVFQVQSSFAIVLTLEAIVTHATETICGYQTAEIVRHFGNTGVGK